MEEENVIKIEYQPALFHRRIFAFVIDFLLAIVIGIFVFIGFRDIAFMTPAFKDAESLIYKTQEESGLYVADAGEGNGLKDVVSYYEDDEEQTGSSLKSLYSNALTAFFTDMKASTSDADYADLTSTYQAYLLDADSFSYEGVSMFILEDGKAIENPACAAKDEAYANDVYGPYITSVAIPALQKVFPSYAKAIQMESQVILFLGIPVSLVLASILVFYIPPLIFKRGRKTLGKLLFNIGQVNKDCLNLSLGLFTAEASIFIFGILLLSLFTLGIPLLISFSLMAFSKKRQDFAMYMLNITDISTEKDKIYFSLAEASLEQESDKESANKFEPVDRRDL